jgi:hypothetical protein
MVILFLIPHPSLRRFPSYNLDREKELRKLINS